MAGLGLGSGLLTMVSVRRQPQGEKCMMGDASCLNFHLNFRRYYQAKHICTLTLLHFFSARSEGKRKYIIYWMQDMRGRTILLAALPPNTCSFIPFCEPPVLLSLAAG